MPVALRALLIVILWVLCGLGIFRSLPHAPKLGFTTTPINNSASSAPQFLSETINPDQGLPMVHVASMALSPDGILHCVWYGGSGECRPDVKIYIAHKEPNGHWTQPTTIMTKAQAERDLSRPVQALGNALLLANPDGSLRLLFVTISMGKWSGSQLNSCLSKDGGLTWSRAERLTLSPFFNLSELVRNRPLPLQSGGWCVPIYQEFLGKFPELLWFGSDVSYRKSRIAGGCTTFQPSIVPLGPSNAVALLRDYSNDRKIFRSLSSDGGASWSHPIPTTLPNPDSGLAGLPIADGQILAAFNNSPKNRADLSLSVTPDDGQTWSRPFAVEREEGASFSYPYLLRIADGSIGMAYTHKGREIRFITFNDAWLKDQVARANRP
jgi:predicted neuraminidase